MSELTEEQKIEAEMIALHAEKNNDFFIPFKNTCGWLELINTYNKYETDTMFRKNFNRRYLRDPEYELVEAQKPEDE